jgi:hypothetical protein
MLLRRCRDERPCRVTTSVVDVEGEASARYFSVGLQALDKGLNRGDGEGKDFLLVIAWQNQGEGRRDKNIP